MRPSPSRASPSSPSPSDARIEACSLNGDDLADRLAEFRSLLGRTVAQDRVGDRLSFRFPLDTEAQVRELARREQECCGFWIFDVRVDPSEVVFNVAVVAARFSQFIDAFEWLAGLPSPTKR